jgi:ABC-type sulfate/molybdate transport systems ATPase subunit
VVEAIRRRGTSALLVTHDRDEALQVGDRVAVMRDGRVLQVDRPDAVYERPVDRFVAGFLGDVAYLPDGNGGTLVARPHHLTLVPGGEDRVIGHRYLGAQRRYAVRRTDGSHVQADLPAVAPLLDVGSACTVTAVAGHTLHRLA